MGLGTLITRAASQTILASWFNDIKAVLCLDVVPRDANGIPSDSAGSLGTEDYPWNNVRCESLFVGGNAIQADLVSAPLFRIKSGKAKTSGYPDFLTAAGVAGGLSATLDGTGTALDLTVNGTEVSVSTDLTYSSLTAAPAANNTCAINDATLAGAASTKTLGELDNKQITINSIGSEITALNGTVAAFAVGTEVFLARVDTTNNRLLPIYRGWAGTSRGTLTNAATITLLKLNTLLLKSDGVTKVTSTYYPATVTTSPAAATSGKVYFERSTNKIGYDNGSSIEYTYMIVGFAVCDSADCLYVQPWDFDLSWKDPCAVELQIKDTTTVTVKARSYASVCGIDVAFFDDSDATQASNMDSGEAISGDTDFHVYLRKDGTVYFSTVAPRKHRHLKAEYHPSEYYRCVGVVRTNSSNNFIVKKKEQRGREWLADAMVPVGIVVPIIGGYFADVSNGTFASALGNTASAINAYLPANWRVCDGSAINDPESPLFNTSAKYLPNLTDSRFIMGSTGAGTIGGATSHSISVAHTHSGTSLNALVHLDSGASRLVSKESAVSSWTADYFAAPVIASSGVGYTSAAEVVGSTGAMSANDSHNWDNKPLYLSAIYVMRVK